MLKIIVFFVMALVSTPGFGAQQFSFAGHVTLKNDVPSEIQLTLFEGDFQMAPQDEDHAAIVESLRTQNFTLESEIYYSLSEGKPNLLIMIVGHNSLQSILIVDLIAGASFFYEVTVMQPGKIISRKQGYSDYILEVTP